MDKERFSTLLKDPSQVTNTDIKALNEYRKKYPYFQSLYVVVAKALKDREHPKTDAFIKKAAIYSANRPHLKRIIEGDYSFIQKEVQESITALPVNENKAISSPKEEPTKTSIPSTPSAPHQEKKEQTSEKTSAAPKTTAPQPEPTEEIKKPSVEENTTKADSLKVGKPKETSSPPSKTDGRDVERDLKEIEETKRRIEALLAGTSPEQKPIQPLSKPKGRKKNQIEIIEKFIQNEPQMDRMKLADSERDVQLEDLASKSLKDKEAFETETLAQLMLKQGKQKRAIEIYEKLSLKFPEKRTYFASQIQKIKSE